MPVELSFHGAAGDVTGSCYLLRTGGLKILVDCGMFQGGPKCDELNYADFGFDPSEVDFLILTHGHLDHCGRIPLLAKRGFKGQIVTTAATSEIAQVVLMDTAHIHEEDYAQWKKILRRRGETQREPLYTTKDVQEALGLFDPLVQYGERFDLNSGVSTTLHDAGHILGAAFVEIDIKGGPRLLFSGDLGNPGKPIIRDTWTPPEADAVIMETTYATRNHRSFPESVKEFEECIVRTFERGGNVLMPAFAIERSQELLYILREAQQGGRIPYCRVFLDSPMAINVTDIMRRHPECFDAATRELIEKNKNPFKFPGVEFTRWPNDSMRINDIRSGAIIIAGSGMMTGGRIKHHLKHNIWREECSLVVVGYQAEDTLGRKIVDGEKLVKIFEQVYRVNCAVHTIGGFSSHAGRDDLLAWLKKTGSPKKVFLTHGEADAIRAFADHLGGNGLAAEVLTPKLHERFEF